MRACFGLLLGLILAVPAAAQDLTKVPPELAKARLDAARKTYEQKLRRVLNRGGGEPESFYVWSRRWRDAEEAIKPGKESRLATARAHLKRMQEIARIFAAYAKTGQGRPEDADAAEYYRIQAEIDLARAKAR